MELYSVLITGANRGIGLEFTRQLVNYGKPPKHVFATYRNEATIQALKSIQDSASKETKVHLLKMDILVPNEVEEVRKYIEKTVGDKGLTVLINNAGVLKYSSFLELTAENLLFHFKANAVGPILLAQTMLPLLKKAASTKSTPGMSFSRAAILNISSLAGSITSTGEFDVMDRLVPSYKISKAALNMGMRVFAAAVKEDNVLVINMCPGGVNTDMGSEVQALLPPDVVAAIVESVGIMQPQESIAAILATITTLDESHHGTFMDRFGKPYGW